MKFILLLLAFACVFTGCQKDIVDYELASQKAEMFITASIGLGLDRKFVASTVDEITVPVSPAMSKALSIKLEHQQSPWQDAIGAMDELITPLTQREQLNAEERYDLEQLINSAVPILKRVSDSPEKAKVGATYLSYLLDYSEPIDLYLLTNLYQMSTSVLTESNSKKYREYILDRAISTLKDPVSKDMPPTRYEVLEWQAHFALKALGKD